MAKIPIDIKSGEIRKESPLIVGIDLGTTNSLVSYIKDGKPVVVSDRNNKNTLIPSVVGFNSTGNILVGENAKRRLVSHPELTIYSVKRLIGQSYERLDQLKSSLSYDIIDSDSDQLVKIKLGDQFYTPVELSAEILKYLKSNIEFELNTAVDKAVITVPAYFNDNQRQATKDAGKLAGLDVLRIINEPTAASLAYGLDKTSAGTIVVYDLGGGTFDVSVLEVNDGVFEVLSTNGDTFLGGDDIDQLIINYWKECEIFSDEELNNSSFKQAVRVTAEQAKIELSKERFFKKQIADKVFELSKDKFEKLIKPMVDKTMGSVKLALKDAKKSIEQIDELILVGGSTRIPFIRKTLEAHFELDAHIELNPDEVVAMGAAIQADVLAGNNKDVLLLDVTPLSMGIETVGGLMDSIISRNTTIPTSAGRSYTTSIDGQKKLKISVYQGERDLVKDNRKLGEFILDDIPAMPAGIPKIQVHFMIDADGILKVRASEQRSGKSQTVIINNQFSIPEEEMAQMLLDSLKHAESDMQERALRESKVEAQSVIQSTEKFIEQNKDHFKSEQLSKLASLMDDLIRAVNESERDKIESKMFDLNEYARPMANTAMDIAVAQAIKGKKI
jgi:molecular chaperone HscA